MPLPFMLILALLLGAVAAQQAYVNKQAPLQALANNQPWDAYIGELLVGYFARAPTSPHVLRGPGGNPMNGCPTLQTWPQIVRIDAPNPCQGSAFNRKGHWREAELRDGEMEAAKLMQWKLSCSPLGGGLVPLVNYELPNGHHFSASQMVPSLTGTTIELRDCTGAAQYFLDEKIFSIAGEPDQAACEKYKSCDGTIYTKYVIRNWAGKTIAETSELHLFQNRFYIRDLHGDVVADVVRVGRWSPTSEECKPDEQRQWQVDFVPKSKGGSSIGDPSLRWAVGELVTMMATRDARRKPSGFVGLTMCEVQKGGIIGAIALVSFIIFAVGMLGFMNSGIPRCQAFFIDLERRLCPRRMSVPEKAWYTP